MESRLRKKLLSGSSFMLSELDTQDLQYSMSFSPNEENTETDEKNIKTLKLDTQELEYSSFSLTL